ERVAQERVVFDDAVVHDRDDAGLVRVRVLVGGAAVRGPAGVADADAPDGRLLAQQVLEVGQLAAAAHHSRDRQPLLRRVEHGHARGVVAAVLEAAQPFDQDRRALALTNVANDSAHARRSPSKDALYGSRYFRRPPLAGQGGARGDERLDGGAVRAI